MEEPRAGVGLTDGLPAASCDHAWDYGKRYWDGRYVGALCEADLSAALSALDPRLLYGVQL